MLTIVLEDVESDVLEKRLTESSTNPKINMVQKLPRYESERKPPRRERRKTVPIKLVTMFADFDRGKCMSLNT